MSADAELPFRIRDVVVAGALLALLAPLLGVVAVAVCVDSQGPAFFRQERVGRYGRPFRIHKFRSMRMGMSGISVSTSSDGRITRLGRFLRSSKLDELPQLFDVFVGTMSLVGPRPEVAKYVERWPADLRPLILSVRPGITDPATVLLRREAEMLATHEEPERIYVEELLPQKAAHYAAYVRARSFWSDAVIILQTILAVLRTNTVSVL